MMAIRPRRRMGLLLGLLLCSLIGVEFFSLGLHAFERRTAKDSLMVQGLPTSLDPWGLDGRQEGPPGRDLAALRDRSLKEFNGMLHEIREELGDGAEVAGSSPKTRTEGIKQEAQANTPRVPHFAKVSPAILQEEKCPGCYGTSLCDKFYAGNITLDMGADGQPQRKGVFFGYLEGRRVVGKHLADQGEFKRLDHFVCQNSSRRVRPNQPCDVSWDILHSHLASQTALDTKYIRNDAHKVAQTSESSLSLAVCASDRFMGRLKDLYGLNRWQRDCSPEIATLMTSLILNPEGLLLKFFEQNAPELSKYFPAYLGECGRMIVVGEAGRPLAEFLDASWEVRADLARQILQMVHDFRHASPDWLVLFSDFDYDNFAVTADGRIQLLDLEDIMVVDKQEVLPTEKRSPLTAPCNEECFVTFAEGLMQGKGRDCGLVPRYSQLMLLFACHKLLSDLESTKYLRFFYRKDEKQVARVGLLRDIPPILEPSLSNHLYSCVFESSAGQRIQSANILKRLLEVTGRGHLRV